MDQWYLYYGMFLLTCLLVSIVSAEVSYEEVTYSIPPTPTGFYDQNCTDKISDCEEFGIASCFKPYESWARENCAKTCQFCQGKPEKPPTCSDVENGCDLYTTSICTDPDFISWAKAKCRRFCRMCPEQVLAELDLMTTTLKPVDCFDKVVCDRYGKGACTGDFASWAKDNCPKYCGFCSTGVTTSKRLCVDKLPNCPQYDSRICTDKKYYSWTDENCRSTCKFCQDGYEPRYRELRQELLTQFSPAEVQINGGVGKRSSFEITINGKLVFSKLDLGGFPITKDVAEAIKEAQQKLEPKVIKDSKSPGCTIL